MVKQHLAVMTASSLALILSACGGGGGSDGGQVDDPLPQISIDDSALNVAEGDDGQREVLLTVALDRPAPETYQIDYSVAADSEGSRPATAGADFVADSGSVEVLAGATSASLALQIVGDRAVEGDETLKISASHAALGSVSAIMTISDDDRARLSVRDASLSEGDSGQPQMTFTVEIDPAIEAGVVSVDYATLDGSAVAGSDFLAASGQLQFAPGETQQQIQLALMGDTAVEPDESFSLRLSNPSANAELDRAEATGSILNDDSADGNRAPVLVAIGARQVQAGESLGIDLSASDADGNPLSFAASGLPAFVSLVDNGDGSARLNAAPQAGDVGDHSITVTVSDGSLSASETFVLSVQAPANRAPVVAAIGAQQVAALDSLQLAISASDADGDALSFSASGLPAFVSLVDNGDGTASLTASPQAGDVGDHSITVSASDGSLSGSQTFVLSVQAAANRAPVVAPIAAQQVAALDSLQLAITASDADGDALSISAAGLPGFAALTDNGDGSATFAANPKEGDEGVYPIDVSVSDGALTATARLTLTVNPPANRAPELTAVGAQSVKLGQTLSLGLSASDADGNPLSFSVSGLPAFASLSDNGDGTASISGEPQQADLGGHSVTVTVSDGELEDSESFQLSVNEADNAAPVLALIGAQSMKARETLALNLSAADEDGDALTFSTIGLPAFASFVDAGDGTATLSLSPLDADQGVFSIQVAVSDGRIFASETFVLTVAEPDNVAPELAAIGALSLKGRETLEVALSASDLDADAMSFSVDNLPVFASLTDNGDGTASLSLAPAAEDEGEHSFTVRVSDGELEGSESVTLTVLEADNVAPELAEIGAQEVKARETLQIGIAASDIDNDALTISVQGLTPFASFTDYGDGTAMLEVDPQDPDQGEHSFTVSVSDGEFAAEETFILTVLEPDNVAPEIAAIGDQEIAVDGTLQISLSASDLDSDPMSYSATGLPGFATLTDAGDGTATLLMQPVFADVGSHTVTIEVSDGELAGSETFDILVPEPPADVVISELMAVNATVLLDGDGAAEDWIELHNRGAYPVDLQSWCLSDNPANSQLWCFPSVTLQPDDYLLVFASGKAGSADANELHASFRLGSGGEYLALFHRDGSLMSSYDPTFPKQVEDVSWGIASNGELHYFESPTPGMANGVGIVDMLDFDPTNAALIVETGVSRTFPVSLERLSGAVAGYSLSVDMPWLSAATGATEDGQTTDAIDLTVDASALSEGSYSGAVTAQSAGAADGMLSVSLQVVASSGAADVEISEFMAANTATLQDGDGRYSDWIELHNRGASAVDLLGWCLTDDETDLSNWCFTESTPLAADGYLLVYASKADPAPAGQHHASFKLGASGEYFGLIKPSGVVADEYAPAFPAQNDDVSYGRDALSAMGYFILPTPGAPNGLAGGNPADAIGVSVPRGFYDTPFNVALSVDMPQVIDYLRYTLDGSPPTLSNGYDYIGPIPISTTTVLRVVGVKDGALKDKVITHSYLFLNDVLQQPATVDGYPNFNTSNGAGFSEHDYEMDPDIVNDPAYSGEMIAAMRAIPTLSISMDKSLIFGETGFYDTDDIEQPMSVEVMYPDAPDDSHQTDGAIEGHSHLRIKRSMRLNFRSQYGASKIVTDLFDRAPLNGDSAMGRYDKLMLRAGNNRCWCRTWMPERTAYTIDQFVRDTQIAANGVGAHGTFAHIYINGLYWGMYNVAERADKHFLADYFGGDTADWFSANHGMEYNGETHLNGDISRYNYLKTTLIYKDMSDPANYAELQQYLEIDPYIDYLLINWWVANGDWPDNNYYMGSRDPSAPEGGLGLRYFNWDAEATFNGPLDFYNASGQARIHFVFYSDEDIDTIGEKFISAKIWHAARRNPTFMARVKERVDALIAPGGALNDDVARARWATLTNHVRSAVLGESARWGDTVDANNPRTRDEDWQSTVDDVDGWLTGNAQALINELIAQGYY